MSLEFLGLSHRIPGKVKNAVYRLETSSLVSEIVKLEKCVKYANERTDDVIHSTHYNIKYINRPISINLQQRLLRFSRLIVLQTTHLRLYKNWFPWQLTLFQSPRPDFMVFGDFKLKKHLTRPHTRPNIPICLMDRADVAPFANFRHCQKFGTRWRLRVRTKAIMAAKSYKEMYGNKETFSNISIMSLRVFGVRLETC